MAYYHPAPAPAPDQHNMQDVYSNTVPRHFQTQQQQPSSQHFYANPNTFPPTAPSHGQSIAQAQRQQQLYAGEDPSVNVGAVKGAWVQPGHGMQQQFQPQQQQQQQIRSHQQTPTSAAFPPPQNALTVAPSTQHYPSPAPTSTFTAPPNQQPPTPSQPPMASIVTLTTQPLQPPQGQNQIQPQLQPHHQQQSHPQSQLQPQLQPQTTQQLQQLQRPQNFGQLVPRPILQPPLSPASAKLETQRVTALLDINRALIQEIVQLQALGRAGPPSQSQGAQHGQHGQISPTKSVDGENEAKKEGGEVKDVSTNSGEGDKPKASVSSKEYMECMRRLQANLAYLANIADRYHKPVAAIQPCPAIIDAPPATPGSAISEESMQGLKAAYKELRELYPDIQQGAVGGPTAPMPLPNTNAGPGNGPVAPVPAASVGVGKVAVS